MSVGYHRIALHALQLNQASSCGKGKVSCFLATGVENLGYILA